MTDGEQMFSEMVTSAAEQSGTALTVIMDRIMASMDDLFIREAMAAGASRDEATAQLATSKAEALKLMQWKAR